MLGLMDNWSKILPVCQSAHPVGCRRGGRVVYCGGLENRFGLTADGGSNPSLSANAKLQCMSEMMAVRRSGS